MKDDLAKRLVQSLKDGGINFVTYLPETRLSQIIPIIRDDPDMELVPVASEAEAVTIAAGGPFGGEERGGLFEKNRPHHFWYYIFYCCQALGGSVPLLFPFLRWFSPQRHYIF